MDFPRYTLIIINKKSQYFDILMNVNIFIYIIIYIIIQQGIPTSIKKPVEDIEKYLAKYEIEAVHINAFRNRNRTFKVIYY